MINRDNYLDVVKYLEFQRDVIQNDEGTVIALRQRLKHLLEWADGTRFVSAKKIMPTFSTYLGGLRNEDGTNTIGTSHYAACCKTARAFFNWAKEKNPRIYRDIDPTWIKTIRPPKARSEQSEVKIREYYELDEVIQLISVPVETIMLRRMQAAVAFLFLSGMRIGAFVSMPINCVDIEIMQVSQLPSKGVRTKNHKAAFTTLINIPELVAVIKDWDLFLRGRVPDHILWFVPLTYDLEPATVNPKLERIKTRMDNFRRDLRQLCTIAGVKYKSPHKFRNGHTIWGLKRAETVEQLKAISQNLMHSTIGITDGIYGNMVNDDVRTTIIGLANVKVENKSEQDALNKVIAMLQAQVKPTAG